jgi:hypothetical protein
MAGGQSSLKHSCRCAYAALLMLAVGVAQAGDPAPVGNVAALRGPQLMLYFRMALGHDGQSPTLYGMRLEQSRLQSGALTGTLGEAPFHQQLLDLQLRPHADMQMQLGRRVSWDFGRESFYTPSKPATLLIRWPLEKPHSAEALPRALIGGWPQSLPAKPTPDPVP